MTTEIKAKIEELVKEFNELQPQVEKAQKRLVEIQGAVQTLSTMVSEETPTEETITNESEAS